MSWRSAIRFPGILGTVAFCLYIAWNCHWLSQRQIPPSILLGLTGLPAPTTGMSRSALAFFNGNVVTGFLWNPFTLPICGMLVLTLAEIVWKCRGRRRLVLSQPVALAWLAVLLAAWIAKLAMGPAWW